MYIVLNKGMKKEITEDVPVASEEKKAEKQTAVMGTSEDKKDESAVMEYMEYTEAVKEPVSEVPVRETVPEAFVEEHALEVPAEAEEEPLEEWKD